MTLAEAFDLALQRHRAGRLAEAEALYRQILAAQPNHAGAMHLLGLIAHQVGRHDLAVDLIHQAVVLDPNNPAAHCNLGEACRALGRPEEAIAEYHRALELKPDYAEAFNNLGVAQAGRDLLEEAVAAFHRALQVRPKYPEALNNLGIALRRQGQLDEAVAVYRSALEINPEYLEALNNLGIALRDRGQLDEAIAACRRALELKPDFPEAHINLGAALARQGRFDEAIAAYRRALQLRADHPEAHFNLGTALRERGQFDEAMAAFRQAIALQPDLPEAHYNFGVALLAQGDFLQGWEEYEWRWKIKDTAFPPRAFTRPQWDGGPLEGRTLLLQAEQGIGDTIQFIRYLPLAAQRGGKIVLECHPELQRLFQTMAPDLSIVARRQALPRFDLHCPLMSLPRIFSTDLGNIPGTAPYLRADAAAAAIWRERLGGPRSTLKVGLVWAGNPEHTNDRHRSLRLASLAPLADVPDVQFYSLQKGAAAAEAGAPPAALELIDVAEDLKDFADSAALIANLDLVIAVDTAIAHLAGAMGKPVWTLLPSFPDWRWLLDRPDSPWYPTMRLFRQPRLMGWAPAIADLRAQLQLLVQSPVREV